MDRGRARDWPERLLAAAVSLLPQERVDWGAAMLAELAQLRNPSTRWQFASSCIRVTLFPPGNASEQNWRKPLIKTIAANPRAAAFASVLLALPISLLFPIAGFQIEPFNGFLQQHFTEADGIRQSTLSMIVFGGGLMLLPIALFLNVVPVLRSVRAGSPLAHPVNLTLIAAIGLAIAMTWGLIIVDQLPCWMGVPNCD